MRLSRLQSVSSNVLPSSIIILSFNAAIASSVYHIECVFLLYYNPLIQCGYCFFSLSYRMCCTSRLQSIGSNVLQSSIIIPSFNAAIACFVYQIECLTNLYHNPLIQFGYRVFSLSVRMCYHPLL